MEVRELMARLTDNYFLLALLTIPEIIMYDLQTLEATRRNDCQLLNILLRRFEYPMPKAPWVLWP